MLGLVLALIGGGVGSVLTWMLYGFSFGTGISAPFAIFLNANTTLGVFFSQFLADMAIDVVDKLVVVTAAFALFKWGLPDGLLAHCPGGEPYMRDPSGFDCRRPSVSFYSVIDGKRRMSLRSKMGCIIVMTAMILGTMATIISYGLYKDATEEVYKTVGKTATQLMCYTLKGDVLEYYENNPQEDLRYRRIVEALTKIRSSFPNIKYMYVYQIKADGCHVLFDLDTEDTLGGSLGDVVAFDDEFRNRLPALLAGQEMEPIVSNGKYGWLLSTYMPIRNSAGECVAYAGTDISMAEVITSRYIFVIRMASLLFAASICAIGLTLWYTQRKVVDPLDELALATHNFAFREEDERADNSESLHNLDIDTGDEIENLYHALEKTTEDMVAYIHRLHAMNDEIVAQSTEITRLQDNIILAFATIVENRDENTGGHIRRTSLYVKMLAQALKGHQLDDVDITPTYLLKIEKSAPLHDIGKIRIPDAILNKPGPLTDEEFEVIKTHPAAAKRILEEVLRGISDENQLSEAIDMAYCHHERWDGNQLSEAIDMAYCHHERWDGKGYPQGIAGRAIPLSARIMAVADVFDALVSKRSYKEAFSCEKAVAIMKEGAGTQFDPQIIAVFLDIAPAMYAANAQ